MDFFKGYILQNWILILILAAFEIVLITTAFLDKKATKRMAILVVVVFLLSISVYTEFYLESDIKSINLISTELSKLYFFINSFTSS